MPRTGLILGRRHGSEHFELASGIEDSLLEQSEAMRGYVVAASQRVHPVYAEVQHWTSDQGCLRALRFSSPEEHKANEARRSADMAAHAAHIAGAVSRSPAPATPSLEESKPAKPAHSTKAHSPKKKDW